MTVLAEDEFKDFEEQVEEGLRHPVGPVPTPNLHKAVDKIKKLIRKDWPNDPTNYNTPHVWDRDEYETRRKKILDTELP